MIYNDRVLQIKELILMKRTIKTISAVLMIAMLVALTIIPSFAAEDTLAINSQDNLNIKKGDIVTYELDLGDCTEDVIGLQANLFYDSQYLKYVDDTLEFPVLNGVVSNPNLDNRITFNWTDITNTADFSKSKPLVKASFEVLNGGETEITYFISELYGDDMTYLKDFTFTYKLYVNDKRVLKDETPVVEQDKDNLDLYVFAATDILNSNSKIISLGNDSGIVEKAYGVTLDDHTAMLENVVSRKKQMLPKILENLD